MADNETTVRDMQWSRVLQVGHVLRAFRIALWPPSKLILCLAALVVTIGCGLLLDLAWKTDVFGQSLGENFIDVYRAATGDVIAPRDEQAEGFFGREGLEPFVVVPSEQTRELGGLLLVSRGFWYAPLEAIRHLVRLIAAYWSQYPLFALINTLVALLAWAFFGGAVCRLAALQFTRDERPGMIAALKFTAQRYASLVMSPLALFIVMTIIAAVVFFAASIILLIPVVGELLVGLFFLLAILFGVILTLLFVFGVSSLGLQMPAIAAEGRDAFDAVSRGVNYVFTKPWRYILYTVFSLLVLSLGFVVVRVFTLLVLKIPYVALQVWPWIGRDTVADDGTLVPGKLSRIWVEPTLAQLYQWPAGAEGTEYVAAVLISVAIWLLLGLMLAFIPSFLLTSQTIIYFLMRRLVDFKDIEEVYVGEEEDMVVRLDKMLATKVEPEPATDGPPPPAPDEVPPASSDNPPQ